MPPRLAPAFFARPIAHRGLHDRASGVIENSRAAITAAAEAGYGIEIDLQLSADGEAMVFHDDTLDRLTDAGGPLCAQPAATLGQIRLSGSEDTIPTLGNVLMLVAGRVPLLIELKDQTGMLTPGPTVLEARVAALLAEYDGPAALMSFNPASVATLRDLAPARPRGRVTCAFPAEEWPGLTPAARAGLARIDDLGPLGASFISHNKTWLDTAPVHRARAAGHDILTWTIRSPAEEAAARPHARAINFEGYHP